MILLVHLMFGAAIGAWVKNIPLAIILAFLSHYFLDTIPHVEYPIKDVRKKQNILPDILKVMLDFLLGISIIFMFYNGRIIVYLCAVVAILPDILFALNLFAPNRILEIHEKVHNKVHFLKYKKISVFWRILSQIAVVIISIILMKN